MHDILSDLITKMPDKYTYKATEFIESENQQVMTYEKFHALMTHVNKKIPENQLKILFHLLDSDENELLSELYQMKKMTQVCLVQIPQFK